MSEHTCSICGASIHWVDEEEWGGWLDETDDQLSYVPYLHYHAEWKGATR